MAAPKRKRVSDEVFRRIAEALEAIAADDKLPRTKRQVEQLADLGHDTVARAFRQDAEEDGAHGIARRFAELVEPLGGGRRSPARLKEVEDKQKVTELNQAVAELNKQLDRYAMTSYAYFLSAQQEKQGEPAAAIPIGRNRKREQDR